MNAAAAAAALDAVEEKWGKPYPAIPRLWRSSWELYTPFLDYDIEIRKVLCSTKAIESLNARYRRAVTTKGHFPTEQAGRIQGVTATPCSREGVQVGSSRFPDRCSAALHD